MDNLSSSFLKYGDEVLLYSEQMVGFLYSEGWFDDTVYLPMVEKDRVKYMLNFVFTVYPKLSYDAKTQLMKLEKALSKGDDEQGDAEQQEQEANDIAKNKEIIQKRVEQEEYYNKSKASKFGEYIVYGRSEIELIHKASGKILTVVRNNGGPEGKYGNYLELREDGTPDKCDFKIMPRYKYRAEGEKIIYGDYFVLYNERTKTYAYISPDVVNKKNLFSEPPDYRPQSKFRRTPPQALFSKNVMKMKPRNSSSFQLIPFRHTEKESERFINGGDIIKIKHTEIGGHLCVDGGDDIKENLKCFVRKYRGTNNLEENDSNCLFEVEINCKEEKGRFLKWKDTKEDKGSPDLLNYTSGDVDEDDEESNTTFRLRHLNSGQHLTLVQGNDGKKHLSLTGLKNDLEDFYSKEYLENTLFIVESQSVDPDERLKPSIVVKIKHCKTSTYISTSSNIERPTSAMQYKEAEEEKKNLSQKGPSPFKLNTRTSIGTDIAKHYLEASIVSKDEDAFIVEQIDPEYIKDCLSLHASVQVLKEYVLEIRTGKDEKLRNKERMKRIEEILTYLIFFVTDTEGSDPFT